MSNTALNRTSIAQLTNKSGGSVAQGDVVIVDSANATAFTTTTTSSYAGGSIGVVMEPNGIASNAIGAVAFGGYVPLVNLSSSASLGDLFHAHSVAKQALRHATPIVGGDFGQVLGTGTTPAAFLWGQPAAAAGGGSSTLAGDTDANISSPANKDALIFDTSDSKWHNKAAFFPAGELGYTQITTATLSTSSASLVDLTGVTVTVTIGSRPVVVSAFIPQWSNSVTNDRALFALIDSTAGVQIQDIVVAPNSTGNGTGFFISVRVNPAAGSRVYKVQFRQVDGGTVTVNSGSTAPTYIQVVEV